MDANLLVGTEAGLWRLRQGTLAPVEAFTAREVTALARDGTLTWALVNGRTVWASDGDARWHEQITIAGPAATCLAPTQDGLLIGTEAARLLRLAGGTL